MASIIESKRQSRLVDLFSTRFDPILTLISLYLGIAGLRGLYQVSKTFYRLKEHVEKNYFNINKRLRDFVVNPDMFRSQMGKYDTLISGGFALSFLDSGGYWKVSNLNILVRAGIHAEEFIDYLRKYEGYETGTEVNTNDEETGTEVNTNDEETGTEVDTNDEETGTEVDTNDEDSQGRLIFVNSTRPDIKIRVIRTSGPPVLALLSFAYTTASVNCITWNKAYSVFPRQTLVLHKFFPLRALDDDFGSVLSEYSKQGWTTRDIIWPELVEDQVRKLGGNRRIGDSSSLVIPLDTSSVQQASTPDSVIEYAQFTIHGERSYGWNSPYRSAHEHVPHIQIQSLESPALRHRQHATSEPWRTYVTERLQRWVWVESYKLKEAERPLQFLVDIPDHSDISLPEEFTVPETWDYADDQIPLWYQEWEQIQE